LVVIDIIPTGNCNKQDYILKRGYDMKVELFLRSIDQEFSDQHFRERHDPNQWRDGYSDYWTGNTHYNTYADRQLCSITDQKTNKLSTFLKIRKESFGGFLFDMLSKAVFKLDDSAYQVMSLLISGVPTTELSSHINIDDRDINTLKKSLEKYCICKI